MPVIEMRSDTFTKPVPAMLEAMLHAPLGDDVWGEDPTVKQLERRLAGLFGMEAGLFCPSGTQSNQLALKTHTQPGQAFVCDRTAHIYQYEAGAYAVLSGLSPVLLEGDRGRLSASQIASALNPDDEHKPPVSLVCLENTANKAGGSVYTLDSVLEIRAMCQRNNLRLHLDGARLFHALAVTGDAPYAWGDAVDSISICLSKGLGCPIGSVLIGTATFIAQARRWRKVFGGGMRQVGLLAAAGLYALDHHIGRLKVDHERAAAMGRVIAERPWCTELFPVQTNIVIFRLAADRNPQAFVQYLREKELLVIDMGEDLIRLVTHLDLSDEDVARALHILSAC